MADLTGKAISELPAASVVNDADLLLLSQSGASKKLTKETLLDNLKAQPLKGKTIQIFGDSLSQNYRWPSELAKYGNPTVINDTEHVTVSGKWLASYVASGQTVNGMAQTISDMEGSNDSNLINVLAIGTNDYRNQCPLGAVADNVANADIFTVFGAMQIACHQMVLKFPNAINVYCIPPRCANRTSASVPRYSMSLMGQGLAAIAKRYGFVIVDLFNGLPNYNPNVGSLKNRWTVWNDQMDDYDGVHPNAAYVPRYAEYIVAHLNPPISDPIPTNYAGYLFAVTANVGTLVTSRFEKIGEQYCRVQLQFGNITNRSGLTSTVINNIPSYAWPSGVAPLTAMYRKDGETFNRPCACYVYQNQVVVIFDDISTDITSLWINGVYSIPSLPVSTP